MDYAVALFPQVLMLALTAIVAVGVYQARMSPRAATVVGGLSGALVALDLTAVAIIAVRGPDAGALPALYAGEATICWLALAGHGWATRRRHPTDRAERTLWWMSLLVAYPLIIAVVTGWATPMIVVAAVAFLCILGLTYNTYTGRRLRRDTAQLLAEVDAQRRSDDPATAAAAEQMAAALRLSMRSATMFGRRRRDDAGTTP